VWRNHSFSVFLKRKIHREIIFFSLSRFHSIFFFPQIEQFSSVFLPSMASKKLVQNVKMKGWKGIDRKSRSVVNGESIFAICSKIENIFIVNFFQWRKGIKNVISFLCLSPQVDAISFPSFLPYKYLLSLNRVGVLWEMLGFLCYHRWYSFEGSFSCANCFVSSI